MPTLEEFWSHGSLIVGVKVLVDKYVRPYVLAAGWLVLVWAAVLSLVAALGRQIVMAKGVPPANLWQFGGAVLVDAIVILTGAVIVTDGHNRAREMHTLRVDARGTSVDPIRQPAAIVVAAPPPVPAAAPVLQRDERGAL